MQTRSAPHPASGRGPDFRLLPFGLLAALPAIVCAQTAPSTEEVVKMDAFEVTGFRSSLASGIEGKRQADQVVDLITAEEVGKFGTQNIAEAIQRISGVSLTRNNGEGEFISVRGMSPHFTRIEIDGRSTFVTADSSQPGRESLLSVFASDVYSSIEVIKSPTAANIEGGAGGTVKLKTPDPLRIGRMSWGVTASLTDAGARDRTEPGFNAFYSNVFANRRLGVLLSATYEKKDRRIDKVQMGDPVWAIVNTTNPAFAGARYPERLRLEGRTGELPRLNLNGKVQFMATPNLELYANTLVTREERNENKARIQVEFSNGQFLRGTMDPATRTLTAAEFQRQRVDLNSFRRETDLDSTGLTGGAKWTGDAWTAHLAVSRVETAEDWWEYTAQGRVNADGVGGYVLGSDPRLPQLYTPAANLAPSAVPMRGLNLAHRIISGDEDEGKLDLKRKLGPSGFTSFEAGVRWSSNQFHRRQGNVNAGNNKPNGTPITFADATTPYVLDGNFAQGLGGPNFLRRWPSVDAKQLYLTYPAAAAVTFNNNNYFDTTEENSAAYLSVNFNRTLGGLAARGNAGVRFVRTEFEGAGRVVLTTLAGAQVLDDAAPLAGGYTEPLPTFNLTLAPEGRPNVLVRGALTRAMTRPTINELTPARSVDAVNRVVTRGEPDLDPFLAWQYDLGLEYYFGKTEEGLLSVAGFFKDVDNFIVPTTGSETLAFPAQGVASQTYTVRSYRNGGTASIRGFEVNVQTPFTFLPGFLSNFGGVVNYTFTDSEFTDVNGHTFTFPGASRDTYNAVLYYQQKGFSAQVAYNFRNDYLIEPSSAVDGSNALYGEGTGRVDLALRYRFKNGLRFSFDVLNLNERHSYKYFDLPQRYQNFEIEGRIMTFSVGYTF